MSEQITHKFKPGDVVVVEEAGKRFKVVVSYLDSPEDSEYPWYVGVCACHGREFNFSAEWIREEGEV